MRIRRPGPDRMANRESKFKQTEDTRLAQVRGILGDYYQYDELAIRRTDHSSNWPAAKRVLRQKRRRLRYRRCLSDSWHLSIPATTPARRRAAGGGIEGRPGNGTGCGKHWYAASTRNRSCFPPRRGPRGRNCTLGSRPRIPPHWPGGRCRLPARRTAHNKWVAEAASNTYTLMRLKRKPSLYRTAARYPSSGSRP